MIRRLPALVLPLAVILLLAACSSGSGPGWTYAPAPSATPAGSAAASGPPSGGPSSAPSVAPTASPSFVPSEAPPESSGPSASTGGTLVVKAPAGAATAGFDPATLEATAGTPFTLKFDNQDNQAPHNLILQNPDGTNVTVTGDTAFFTGPGEREYQVPGLSAGTYAYICQVHPTTMKGTLTVK